MKIKFKNTPSVNNFILFFDSERNLFVSDKWKKNNKKLSEFLTQFLQLPENDQKHKSICSLRCPDLEKVLLAKIDTSNEFFSYRKLGAVLGKLLLTLEAPEVALLLPEFFEKEDPVGLEDLFEGLLLGNYQFNEYKSNLKKIESKKVKTLQIIKTQKEAEKIFEVAKIKADSTNLSRNWGNQPGNQFTPTHFKKDSSKIAKEAGLKFSCLDEKQMKNLGFGCLLGVTSGSDEPAFLNILEYKSKIKSKETILLVGKGLTFDSGGISIKPASAMDEMKYDMCGGAAVLGAMRIIGLLKPQVNVVGLIPSSENLSGGSAMKPGDILTAYNGKTVEVLNTDAEGRLILADAISYGVCKYKPTAIIDIATLTGACVVALGSYHSGMFSNHKSLTAQLKKSAKRTEDLVWEMPVTKEYEKQIEGTYGDIKNIGGKEAGAVTAAMFLQHFTEGLPWVHLDIAGTAWNVKDIEFHPEKGATGAGTRLLADFILNWKDISETYSQYRKEN